MEKEITEKENLEIMRKCPRFEFCNVSICPLDYFQDERVKFDGEEKCALSKSIRKRIGIGTQLKYQGMTKKEFTGKQSWESKSDEEKRKIIERGKNQLSKLRYNII